MNVFFYGKDGRGRVGVTEPHRNYPPVYCIHHTPTRHTLCVTCWIVLLSFPNSLGEVITDREFPCCDLLYLLPIQRSHSSTALLVYLPGDDNPPCRHSVRRSSLLAYTSLILLSPGLRLYRGSTYIVTPGLNTVSMLSILRYFYSRFL